MTTQPDVPVDQQARHPLRRAGVRRLLTLEVDDAPDALVRVLTTLRRRRCLITYVHYVAPDRHHPGRFVIGIEAPREHAHCVDAWLINLVDVVAVDSAQR